jgi:rod shape-determining protein MreD
MKWLATGVALALAFAIQSALTLILPGPGRLLDPFLVVVVYCGLTGGETQGMLAGAAAGWIQDTQFGGTVTGLSALTKLIIGFAVGVAATRFLMAATSARLLVLFAATLVDALVFERLALVFEIGASEVSLRLLFARAIANAVLGVLAFQALELRMRREARS